MFKKMDDSDSCLNMKHYLLLSFLLLIVSCSRVQDGPDCVSLLKDCAELASVEYTYDMLFQNEPAKWENLKPGPRKILYSGKAYVKAGIDLTDLSSVHSEVSADGKTLHLVLPEPEVLEIKFEEEGIQREFEKVGHFRSDFSSDEKLDIRQKALKELRKKLESGSVRSSLITDAEHNVRTEMELLILATGRYESVSIDFR